MKRILSLMLALFLVFGLVACESGKDTSSDMDTSTTTQTDSTDANDTKTSKIDTTDENLSDIETPSSSASATMTSKNDNSSNKSSMISQTSSYDLCELDCYYQGYSELYVVCFKIYQNGTPVHPNGSANLIYFDETGKEMYNNKIYFNDNDMFSYDNSTSLCFISLSANTFSKVPDKASITINCSEYSFEEKIIDVDVIGSLPTTITLPNLPIIVNSDNNKSTIKIININSEISSNKITINVSGEVLEQRNYCEFKCNLYDEEGYVLQEYGYAGDISTGSKFKTSVHFFDFEEGKQYRLEII